MTVCKLYKKCKHGSYFNSGTSQLKSRIYCCHPSQMKNGPGKEIKGQLRECNNFVEK